jgi:tetratricopeptide (TPR) repeat protein
MIAAPPTSSPLERFAHVRWQQVLPWVIALLLLLVYFPALSGGFLVWDDPWLVDQTSRFSRTTSHDVQTIFTDFSLATRVSLGSEYLPLRDLSYAIEAATIGLQPARMRVDNLIIYTVAIVLLREAMLNTLGRKWTTELCVLLFALHPVHVESVAWIAGRKDVLALCFTMAMLWAWCKEEGRSVGWALVFYTCALLSKPMSVAAVVLLPVFDLVAQRRFAWRSLLLFLIPAAAIMPLHWKVASLVHSVGVPLGATRWSAAATMGPVLWRYLECCFNPNALSALHDVPTRTTFNMAGAAAFIGVVVTLLASTRSWWRNEEPAWFAAWLTFFVPLIPASQIFAPLQTRMADRYLWLSVLGLSWLVALLMRKLERVGAITGLFFLVLFGGGTAFRASVFSDSVSLFSDATAKTSQSTLAPYLLGYAWEQRKNEPAARSAYEEVLRRNGQDESTRSATNSLARLEVRRGALAHAETILRKGIQQYPEDGKMRDSLIKVLFREGKVDEARHLFGLPPSTAKPPPAPPKPSAGASSSSEITPHKHHSRASKSIRLF